MRALPPRRYYSERSRALWIAGGLGFFAPITTALIILAPVAFIIGLIAAYPIPTIAILAIMVILGSSRLRYRLYERYHPVFNPMQDLVDAAEELMEAAI